MIEQQIGQLILQMRKCPVVKSVTAREDLTQERPRILVKVRCVNLIHDALALSKAMRDARAKVNPQYAIQFTIRTTL